VLVRFLQVSISWLHEHPLVVSLLLFVIGCVVSIYSSEIKQFLREWPRQKIETRARGSADARLRLLKALKDNPYQLLLFTLYQFYDLILTLVWVAFSVSVIYLIIYHKPPTPSIPLGFCGGWCIGKAQTLREIMVQLYRFDKTVAELEKRLG
jgi:hypothetical protein